MDKEKIYLPTDRRAIVALILAEVLYIALHLWKEPENWLLIVMSTVFALGILGRGRSFLFDSDGVTIYQIIPYFQRKVAWEKLKNVERIRYSVTDYIVLLNVEKSYPKPPFLEAKSFFFDLRYFRHMTMIPIPEAWASNGTADRVIALWMESCCNNNPLSKSDKTEDFRNLK